MIWKSSQLLCVPRCSPRGKQARKNCTKNDIGSLLNCCWRQLWQRKSQGTSRPLCTLRLTRPQETNEVASLRIPNGKGRESQKQNKDFFTTATQHTWDFTLWFFYTEQHIHGAWNEFYFYTILNWSFSFLKWICTRMNKKVQRFFKHTSKCTA